MYTLMRSVDSKEFLRTILKLQNDGTNTRVQVLVFDFIFRVSLTYMHKLFYIPAICVVCITVKLAVFPDLIFL
jgi:hypothetical protein